MMNFCRDEGIGWGNQRGERIDFREVDEKRKRRCLDAVSFFNPAVLNVGAFASSIPAVVGMMKSMIEVGVCDGVT